MTSRKIGLYTDDLTERELEVCNLIKKGVLEYNDIAAKLFVSKTTIQTHINNIFQKLKIHSMKELVYYLLKKIVILINSNFWQKNFMNQWQKLNKKTWN